MPYKTVHQSSACATLKYRCVDLLDSDRNITTILQPANTCQEITLPEHGLSLIVLRHQLGFGFGDMVVHLVYGEVYSG